MQEPGFSSKMDEQWPAIRMLLYGIIDEAAQIRANNLNEKQQRHIENIETNTEKLLAIFEDKFAEDDEDKYLKTLHRFCEQFEKWRETVLADMGKGLWKEYAIRFETFVKTFDLLGNKDLSQRSGNLLSACRKGEFALCLQETAPACDAMEAFRQNLLGTSIFQKGPSNTSRITVQQAASLGIADLQVARSKHVSLKCNSLFIKN